MGWLTNWNYRKKIIIDQDKLDGNLSNFPVMVELSDSNFNFNNAKTNGEDIRFTSDDGQTLLKFQREIYDSSTGVHKAIYHVKIPTIQSGTGIVNEFYMYYGNDSASDGEDIVNTWDSDFVTIHHLTDSNLTGIDVEDSTSNDNDGTKKGTNEPLETNGKVYKAQQYDGTDDYINIGTGVNLTSNYTIETLIKISAWDNDWEAIFYNKNFSLEKIMGQPRIAIQHKTSGGSWVTSVIGQDLNLDTWYYIVGVWDGSQIKVYLNEVQSGTPTNINNISTDTGNAYIGLSSDPYLPANRYFEGDICEIRLSQISRSSAWLKATYYTLFNNLLTFGIEEYFNEIRESDTFTLSDDIELNLSLDKQEEQDTITLSDEINVAFLKQQELLDSITLSDDIDILLSKELSDILTLGDTINIATIELSINDFYNKFNMVNGILKDINNDIRTLAEGKFDINNDIRFLKSWQVAGDAGYQSLGKTYIKVYIDSVEQIDIDVDSITISKTLNSPHSATFILGRPYDNNKPTQELPVEIKYHIWTLYKGYITQINPGDRPDSIKIICQDEYWKQNKTKKYFFVGHKPQDNHELYYNYISQGLSTCGASFGIGEFIPQTMSCFGRGTSDCITNLVTNSGNFGWYYDVDNTKKLWTAGEGDIINLEKQEIGKNLGLYQVLNHSFRESIENIVNKFRVQMGNIVIRRFNKTGGNKEYSSYRYENFYGSGLPAWDSTYERLAKDSLDGHGVFYHPVSQNDLYKDVFTKYSLPSLSSDLESWSDRFPPIVQVLIPFGFWKSNLGEEGYLTEGFTIDYENGFLIFNEPIYLYQTNEVGEMTDIRAPEISLQLWKRKYYSNTENPSDNPATDISNPLMFFTDKMGDYPETIMENLELGGLGIQIGGWYVSGYTDKGKRIWTYVPSWNDTNFAKDYVDWQLSKRCDKKINGNIEVTIDAIYFYNIDLSKRIMIDEIIENPLNIESITLNIANWRASIGLQSNRYYKRNVSFQNHGV